VGSENEFLMRMFLESDVKVLEWVMVTGNRHICHKLGNAL